MTDRFLVQIQPASDEYPSARYFDTLAEAEASAEEIWPIVTTSGSQIYISNEENGEQRYRRPDGSWSVMSGPTDYGSPPAERGP